MTAPVLGIIADDFTGAAMVAGMLESAGLAAPLRFCASAEAPPAGAVLIAATRARTVPRAEALAMIAEAGAALQALGCARLAYKACASFDSTEEGNIGPAADWLAERSGRRPVLLSAGFPRFGATVHQGYLFYRNRLVTDSVKRLDPLTPMPDPDLARFLGRQTPKPVALIPHLTLVQGLAATQDALRQLAAEGAGHVLLDSSDDGDIETGAALAEASGLPVAASDPLLVALALRLGRAWGGGVDGSGSKPRPDLDRDRHSADHPTLGEAEGTGSGPACAPGRAAGALSGPASSARRSAGSGSDLASASGTLHAASTPDLAPGSATPRGPAEDRAPGPAVVLAGSTGPVVLQQLAALAEAHPVLVLDLLDPRPLPAQAQAALDWAAAQEGPFAISTATDAPGLARSQAALGAAGAARRAEALLAAVAAGLLARGRRRFVVAGGETSGAVVRALGPGWARALPEAALGLGGCVATVDGAPLSLFLKPGKLGPPEILLRAARAARF